jgi:hypothetical protein
MICSNDNRPPAEASRVLSIVGRVDPSGAVVLTTAGAIGGVDALEPELSFPSDPREA